MMGSSLPRLLSLSNNQPTIALTLRPKLSAVRFRAVLCIETTRFFGKFPMETCPVVYY
jgi:hypothetical protein